LLLPGEWEWGAAAAAGAAEGIDGGGRGTRGGGTSVEASEAPLSRSSIENV